MLPQLSNKDRRLNDCLKAYIFVWIEPVAVNNKEPGLFFQSTDRQMMALIDALSMLILSILHFPHKRLSRLPTF